MTHDQGSRIPLLLVAIGEFLGCSGAYAVRALMVTGQASLFTASIAGGR